MPRTNGSSTQRGYGSKHRAKRAEWEPKVRAGQVDCHATVCLIQRAGGSRRILPRQAWDLGHTPDRTAYTGPEHMRCNRSEGASRGNRRRKQPTAATPQTPGPAVAARRWAL